MISGCFIAILQQTAVLMQRAIQVPGPNNLKALDIGPADKTPWTCDIGSGKASRVLNGLHCLQQCYTKPQVEQRCKLYLGGSEGPSRMVWHLLNFNSCDLLAWNLCWIFLYQMPKTRNADAHGHPFSPSKIYLDI